VERFTPPKLVWTDADFEQMSWHGCRLHGVGLFDDFNPHLHELRLDIDYIFEWRGFHGEAEQSSFWISPATLVFASGRFHIDIPGLGGDWIIDIQRDGEGESTKWVISLNTGGSITVHSGGFRQYIRRIPIFVATSNQYLETTHRGGISFDIATPQA
jgi:hypothetical protein